MIVGVTGSIGSGKSTVCEYLRTKGFYVLNADAISRQLMEPAMAGYQQVVKVFGKTILHMDQSINRSALADRVFKDEKARKQLEDILHPLILQKLKQSTANVLQDIKNNGVTSNVRTTSDPVTAMFVFWEIPLLFETQFQRACDKTVCVVTSDSLLLKRVMSRSSLTEEQVRQRLNAQMPVAEKTKLADYVIFNDGSLSQLYAQVDALVKKLSHDLHLQDKNN